VFITSQKKDKMSRGGTPEVEVKRKSKQKEEILLVLHGQEEECEMMKKLNYYTLIVTKKFEGKTETSFVKQGTKCEKKKHDCFEVDKTKFVHKRKKGTKWSKVDKNKKRERKET